jgi:hypothetical protein
MKTCPNCQSQVNEAATGCPECGARWADDGAYLGPPPDSPAYTPVEQPTTVAAMTPDQLGALIFRKAFWGAVLAIVAVTLTFWLLAISVGGCVAGID